MKPEQFKSFLSQLGYPRSLLKKGVEHSFSYSIHANNDNLTSVPKVSVDYFYCSDTESFFNFHLSLWNQNKASSFIAVFDDQSYIIDSRHKPNKDNPFPSRIIIKSFDYGVNSLGYDVADKLHLITKDGLDNAYYFNFVIEHQKRKKANEVDKDLLLNLLELRNDLVTKQNEEVIHLLLLRCLFVKYLEDRGVFENNYLFNALNAQSPEKLISTFRKVRKINGDLFKNSELRAEDINAKYLNSSYMQKT